MNLTKISRTIFNTAAIMLIMLSTRKLTSVDANDEEQKFQETLNIFSSFIKQNLEIRIRNDGGPPSPAETPRAGHDTLPDTIMKLPEYVNMRYVAPAHFKKTAKILFWTPAYSHLDHWFWWFSHNNTNLQEVCPDLPCTYSINKSDLDTSDALVFMVYSDNLNLSVPDIKTELPPTRLATQRWIFTTLEPPEVHKNLSILNGLFNWTMTYRRDSDVWAHFGSVILNRMPIVGEREAAVGRNYASGKSKPVAWMVSHCPTDGRREEYVDELKKYIPVDVYGNCGSLKCDPPRSNECFDRLGSEYKFYLSFENILCKDYVTEKFMALLSRDVVPVVLGGADYSLYAPRGSYIDALDFDSPKQLAEYLNYLDKNDTEYNRYFDWKRGYTAKTYSNDFQPYFICQLCLKLLDPNEPSKVYDNIHDWFNTQSQCRKWNKDTNETDLLI